VVLWHSTFLINSLAHVWGSRRFDTTDTSRNNFWLALLTMGEGWHNNHHKHGYVCRQGLRWYEVDLTWYVLWTLERLGVIRDVRRPRATGSDTGPDDDGRRGGDADMEPAAA
jgi:stearoyl-CoA desaturase (delta-9 desaturase)